ncbi:hypothetical protein AVEN_179639-1 [Araneus ventricosus]|uniref:Uncharacterized protein n=1 Tax=Araneus ventricosus TaxID=182803 RepID=A0A4Y2BCY8_ARAVE|nr:hypothetical protein AVEN_179639-1 [Araneus ventricosus]
MRTILNRRQIKRTTLEGVHPCANFCSRRFDPPSDLACTRPKSKANIWWKWISNPLPTGPEEELLPKITVPNIRSHSEEVLKKHREKSGMALIIF